MSSMPPAPGPGPVVPSKKVSPIVWVVVGILGFFLLIGIALVAGGLFVAKKIADNPMLAAATAIAAANPDVEIVSNSPSSGTVTFREKSSGKTVTLNFDQIRQGRIVFSEDGKDVVVEAGQGGVHVKSSDGATVDIGAGPNRMPDWIPSYPGAKVEGTFASRSDSEESATATFNTKDSPQKVLTFFEDQFKRVGLKTTSTTTGGGSGSSGGVLTAVSDDSKRQASITVSSDGEQTNVGVTFSSKK